MLIEGVGGTTHAGSLSGIACVDDRIADYFATGALPERQRGNRSDEQCDPVSPPDPTEAAAAVASSSGLSRSAAADAFSLKKQLSPALR